MPTVIALLRGVNVGGNHKVPMAQLRALCEAIGLKQPETFIQSGNIIFESGKLSPAVAARKLESAIENEFGFRSPVIVRTPAELRGVLARNPFGACDPAKLLVTFLADYPPKDAVAAVRAIPAEPEKLHLDRQEMFVYYSNGMGKTRLPIARIERLLGCAVTTRNWNTVQKLLSLAEAREMK